MNKEDLRAWKAYDNNVYSLVPGLNHQNPKNKFHGSKTPMRENSSDHDAKVNVRKGQTDDSHKKQLDRMAKYGLINLNNSSASVHDEMRNGASAYNSLP